MTWNSDFEKYLSHDLLKMRLKAFPNKSWILRVCSTSLFKTLREKEKFLLVTSVFYPFGELSTIFTKSYNVVCKLFQFGRV